MKISEQDQIFPAVGVGCKYPCLKSNVTYLVLWFKFCRLKRESITLNAIFPEY